MRKLWLLLVLCGFLSMIFVSGSIAALIQTLGEQDFLHGDPIEIESVEAAGDGEPFPFDGYLSGGDGSKLGQIKYTHRFSLGKLTPLSSTLTLGLLDHDSFDNTQDTIDIFFDGVQQDDSAFLGISIDPASASVVTLPVDVGLLLDDSLTVNIVATLPSEFKSGNSLGVDFSTLIIDGTTGVPEPATLLLLTSGLFFLAGCSRKKSRR